MEPKSEYLLFDVQRLHIPNNRSQLNGYCVSRIRVYVIGLQATLIVNYIDISSIVYYTYREKL